MTVLWNQQSGTVYTRSVGWWAARSGGRTSWPSSWKHDVTTKITTPSTGAYLFKEQSQISRFNLKRRSLYLFEERRPYNNNKNNNKMGSDMGEVPDAKCSTGLKSFVRKTFHSQWGLKSNTSDLRLSCVCLFVVVGGTMDGTRYRGKPDKDGGWMMLVSELVRLPTLYRRMAVDRNSSRRW